MLKNKGIPWVFSWKTSDTNESVSNSFSCRGALPCKLLLPDGTVYIEEDYEGYGIFGGEDYYSLLAELNGLAKDRDLGIDLEFGTNTSSLVFPKVVTLGCSRSYSELPKSKTCSRQGYFY